MSKTNYEFLLKLAESYSLKGENSDERETAKKIRICAIEMRDLDQTALYYRERTIDLEQEVAKLKGKK